MSETEDTGGECRIFVADDDPSLRFALRTMLELESGMTVVGEAADGAEAVAFIDSVCGHTTACPDVMILDLNMPRLDGYGALRLLRESCPHVQVIVYSGEDAQDARRKVGEIGSYVFVQKGDPRVLITEVQNLCGR